MKKLIGWLSVSLFIPFQLLCGLAQAQTYVDETSNFGNFTREANADTTGSVIACPFSTPTTAKCWGFGFIDAFSLPNVPSYTLGTTTLTVYGQNGGGSSGGRGSPPATYKTTFNAPQLFLAQIGPQVNGVQPEQTDIGPALDINGVPVAFTCTSTIKSPCTAWSWAGELPTGAYNLHLAGASCGGFGCELAGGSEVFVHSAPQYVYTPPPPTCGTPTTPPCDD